MNLDGDRQPLAEKGVTAGNAAVLPIDEEEALMMEVEGIDAVQGDGTDAAVATSLAGVNEKNAWKDVDLDLDVIGDEEAPIPIPRLENDDRKQQKQKTSRCPIEEVPAAEPYSESFVAMSRENSLVDMMVDSLEAAKARGHGCDTEPVLEDSVSEPSIDSVERQSVPDRERSVPIRDQGNTRTPTPSECTPTANQYTMETVDDAITVANTRIMSSLSPNLNERGEIVIPEATAVNDEDIPAATVVQPEKYALTIAGKKIKLPFLVAGMIALLVLVITLSVTLSKNQVGSVAPPPMLPDALTGAPSMSSSPSVSPSNEPSGEPTAVLQSQLIDIISNYSRGMVSDSFSDGQSTHRTALRWLVEDQTAWELSDKPSLSNAEIVERFVLALLYYETGGAGWSNKFDFVSDSHVCRWKGTLFKTFRKGITKCTPDMRVKNLTLPSNNLKGRLPTELGLLKELAALHMRMNDISGSLPGTLGSLQNLAHLELNSNDLSGSIDPLARMAGLRFIDLSTNDMSGQLMDARNLTKLQTFIITNNQFSGSVPRSFADIPSLDTLYLNDNKLSGDFDFFCKDLPSDMKLDCYGDVPELSCSCCVDCTLVSDTKCQPEVEKPVTLNIFAGYNSEGFRWELRDRDGWVLVAAGGLYENGERLSIMLCLPHGRQYSISSFKPFTPRPTYSPTASQNPTAHDLCSSLNRKQCRKDTRCIWDDSDYCSLTTEPTPSPTYNPTASQNPTAHDPCSSLNRKQCRKDTRCIWDDSDYCYLTTNPTALQNPTEHDPCSSLNRKQCRKDTSCTWDDSDYCYSTTKPTPWPTFSPTLDPTLYPTWAPTFYPTLYPTLAPTVNSLSAHVAKVSFAGDGFNSSIVPNERDYFYLADDPTPSPSGVPSDSLHPSLSSLPTSRPTSSVRPSSSSQPSSPTSSPTFQPTTYEPTVPGAFIPITQKPTRPPDYYDFKFELTLVTDAFGDDTSWSLIDRNSGSLVVSESGFASNRTHYFSHYLDQSRCYNFTITDEFDDGICCEQGDGSYMISINGNVIKTGGKFESSETVTFCISTPYPAYAQSTPYASPSEKKTPFPSPSEPTSPFPTELALSTISGGFICPSAGLIGCTASGPNNPEDECPVLGGPCPASGEFCCLDACLRKYCTKKQAVTSPQPTGPAPHPTTSLPLSASPPSPSIPVAYGDTVTVYSDNTSFVSVLENDTSSSGETLEIQRIAEHATNGECRISFDLLEVVYEPNEGFVGRDSCDYEACNSAGECDTATLTIEVIANPLFQ